MARIPYSRVVDVTVTREDRFASAQGFSTALLLTPTSISGQLDATRRTKLYAAIEEVAVDWLATTEEYKAAQRFFQARVRPPALKFGYFNPAGTFAIELDTLYAADPDWYWGLHLKALNDTANQRALADWAESRNVIFGLDSNDPDTETPTAVADASATVTITIASPGVVTWNAHGLAAGDPVRFTTTGALPTGITAGTTYYVAATPAPTCNSLSVAATAGGIAIATTGTQSGTHTATAPKFGGSIAEYCESKSYDRSPVFYHTDPDSYLAAAAWGYAAGRNLDRSNYALARRGRIDSGQAYTLKFKNLPGVVALNKSSAVVQAITGFVPSLGVQGDAGHAANCYVNIGGLDMLLEGTVPSRAFIDEIHATDWMRARMQESVLSLLANAPRVPMTNTGVGYLISGGVEPPLRRAFAAGIIADTVDPVSGDLVPAFETEVDDVLSIPVAQRRNRIAPDIKVRFRYAGAVHFASVTMTMQF